jgi:hypothetical protein
MSAWKEQMWFSYGSRVSAILESVLRGRNLGSTFGKTLDMAKQLVIHGAWFLISGDSLDGQVAMNRIDSVLAANLADVSDLCGMLATLIAAGTRRNFVQGRVSGRALIERYQVKREQLKPIWLTACPPTKIIDIRKAA